MERAEEPGATTNCAGRLSGEAGVASRARFAWRYAAERSAELQALRSRAPSSAGSNIRAAREVSLIPLRRSAMWRRSPYLRDHSPSLPGPGLKIHQKPNSL